MFHILESQPTKVRWCWLARKRGTSTASPQESTVLVFRVATLGGWRNPARFGTPYTCAFWNTTSAATSLRCSSILRAYSSWGGRSAASTSLKARHWMLSRVLVCEAAHDIQERAAYSNYRSTSTPRTLTAWRGRRTPPKRSLRSNAGPAAGDRESIIACVFSGAKVTSLRVPHSSTYNS
ncbi:hypothetical protein GWK47_015981 [Chionoecetes opilio]|uniref:Uncharacterized protein n=1 Tax=Chionoecetes opilio TaxID=41210 RepID=A0A8J4XS00_CHIOP|nr:hypothetical protein GWK47_015981 [Chionoecetes opilio]